MTINSLTQEFLKEALHYNPETGALTWKVRPLHHFKNESSQKAFNTRYAGTQAGSISTKQQGNYQYRQHIIKLAGKFHVVARVIWLYMTGSEPNDQIDHINGDSTDQRWSNLRDVTQKVNSNNLKRFANNTSGIAGVYLMANGKWRAQGSFTKPCGKYGKKNLGNYDTIFDAACARKLWEIEQGHFSERHGT